jgi:NDP-sugar pyrophosphorylase family protein/aminoglycoside/choline kinase family phosphotransferase
MGAYNFNIFLPAAGLGERLRPVTNHMPKPLLPVLGRPLIEIILERLTSVCSGEIGINLHYKSDMLRAWAASSPWKDRIRFFPEDPILGTGGALKNAEPFLSRGPFIVHNSDILLDIDFSRLISEHLTAGNTATLACHRLPHLSNVVIDGNSQVLDVENPGDSKPDPSIAANKIAYTGIAVYSPELLKFLPPGVSHATVAWLAASKSGHKVRAMDFTGSSWNDVGTPATYARGVLDALRENGETVWLSSKARCNNVELDGYAVLESGSVVQEGSRLRNCIVMPGALVSGGHENQVLGPDYAITLTDSDMQPTLHAAEKKRVSLADPLFSRYFSIEPGTVRKAERGDDLSPSRLLHPAFTSASASAGRTPADSRNVWSDAILIGLGGSDRRYFRVRNNGNTAVLMECRPDDPDYERHLVYSRFFETHAVPVPGLIASEDRTKRALFEDLGDTSLYSYMKSPHDPGRIEEVYCSVLDILVKLHTSVTDHVRECPKLLERVFDYAHLRWETGYFLERFVLGLKGIDVRDRQALDQEFHQLAQSVGGFPKVVIHRDFQSQNIMVRADSLPRVIDFQGARMAPPAYDVASILWDPYHRLDNGVRERLLAYYATEMKKAPTDFNEQAFLTSLLPCRLQRHMQALGAYGFLSAVKGKKYFLKHIPEALRLLKEETAAARDTYPELYGLVKSFSM